MNICLRLSVVFALGAASCVFAADLIAPSKMPSVGTVDERFQSFNVEMVEVTGGRFWAAYKKAGTPEAPQAGNLRYWG